MSKQRSHLIYTKNRFATDLLLKHKIDTAKAERMVWTSISLPREDKTRYTERAELLT